MRRTFIAGAALAALLACSGAESPPQGAAGGAVATGGAGAAGATLAGVGGLATGGGGAPAPRTGESGGAAAIGGGAGARQDAGTSQGGASVADAAPPHDATDPSGCGSLSTQDAVVWLRASEGVTVDPAGTVSAWKNLVGSEVARPATDPKAPKGAPLLVRDALNGKPVVRFRGNPDIGLDPSSDLLQLPVSVDGATALTIALVNASPKHWASDPNEWCHRSTPTGCSSTYYWVLGWNGRQSWSGVLLSPRDEEIGFRFGPGMDLDSHCFGNNGANISGPDPCMKYPRPSSIGTSFSLTVAVHDATSNRLYVDGMKVHEAPIAHGIAAVSVDPPLNLGNNTFAHNGGGDIAELLVYRRALADADREALERTLLCTYLPARARR